MLICLFLGLTSQAHAKTKHPNGSILRPIAWQSETCSSEAFPSILRFVADTPEAELFFKGPLDTFPEYTNGGIPDCGGSKLSHSVREIVVLQAAIYDANLIYVTGQGYECLQNGQDYLMLDLSALIEPDFVLHEDFADSLQDDWTYGVGASFVPGTGVLLGYDENVDNSVSSASTRFGGLVPGVEYVAVFWSRTGVPCSDSGEYAQYDGVDHWLNTEPGLWRVGTQPEADYSTFSQALNQAAAGDTVLVLPGTYTETDIDLKDGVVVRGTPSFAKALDNSVVIDAGGEGPVFRGSGLLTGVRLEALTIMNADSGAVVVTDGILELASCRFENNSNPESGGAVRAFFVELRVENCEFVGNSSSGKGGG
ncbi:hypothetical protein DRQ50_09205, partial [bacterium]